MSAAGGVVDGRRAAFPHTGIGRYVAALRTEFDTREGPTFIAGRGLRVRTTQAEERDLLSRSAKVTWEQVALPRYLKRRKPTFLHTPWYEGPFRPPCPLITTVQDLDTLIHPARYSAAFRLYYNELLLSNVRRAALILAPSATTASDLKEYLEVEGRVRVVPLGVDTKFQTPDSVVGEATLRLLGPCPRPTLISGAGTGIRKNIPFLIPAAERVAASLGGATLILTGIRADMSSWARSADSSLRIVLTGVLSDEELAGLYSIVDLSICPSLYEGFGFALIEAMAAGCPVIASAAGSHIEIGGAAAHYFDPRDEDELVSLALKVLSDEGMRISMRNLGRSRSKQFSWERTASATLAAYSEVDA